MSSDVEKIKDKLSIIEVVSPYVKLEKSGRTLKGKSPFNVERTPSFHVDPDKNLFHCFSSGKGGDIFTFIQEVENVDFQAALKMLAEKAGVTLSGFDKKTSDERTQLYELMELATRVYEVAFRKDTDAVQYMLDRGVTKETLKKFRIGYAPAGWQHLVDQLKAKGYSDQLIEKAGLGVPGKRGVYDRFRERIMFPIADGQGRVVAFTGRIFVKSDSDTDPTKTGKYVNSPETPIYHKSKVLYGFDLARQEIMQADTCVVVEGQMDAVMSHQAGVENCVALSGTALTDEQVLMIQRFTDTIILALDSDRAGIAAVTRSVDVAYAQDMATKVIVLTTKDPADLVKEDPAAWQKLVQQPVDYIDFRLGTIDAALSVREKTSLVQQDVYPAIVRMKSDIMQDHARQKVAHFIGVDVDTVRRDFEKWESEYVEDAPPSTAGSHEDTSLVQEKKNVVDVSPTEERILGILIWQESESKPLIDVAQYRTQYYEAHMNGEGEKHWDYAQKDASRLIFEASLRYDTFSAESLTQEIINLMVRMELQTLEEKQHTLTQQLRQAERAGDEHNISQLLTQHQKNMQRIIALKNQETGDA